MREKDVLKYFVLLLIFLFKIELTCSLKNKDRSCTQEGPCLCVYRNGSRIDISGLTNNVSSIKLNETSDIFYNPCVDTVFPNATFSSSILLRTKSGPTQFQDTSLGNANEGKFSDNIDGTVSIQFRDKQTTILLTCDKNQSSPLLKGKEESGHYNLELISSKLCLVETEGQSSISTGSMLVLIFLVMSVVYFGGGVLTLRLLRGAEGKEMIPNYEFWADLPYLVRDGILFTLSGFQSSPSYDRI